MTNPELCERIALRWCKLMNLDPGEMIPHGGIKGLYTTRFGLVVVQVPDQIAWIRAILEHSAEMAAEES